MKKPKPQKRIFKLTTQLVEQGGLFACCALSSARAQLNKTSYTKFTPEREFFVEMFFDAEVLEAEGRWADIYATWWPSNDPARVLALLFCYHML